MAEQEAVNFKVGGSNPPGGAIKNVRKSAGIADIFNCFSEVD